MKTTRNPFPSQGNASPAAKHDEIQTSEALLWVYSSQRHYNAAIKQTEQLAQTSEQKLTKVIEDHKAQHNEHKLKLEDTRRTIQEVENKVQQSTESNSKLYEQLKSVESRLLDVQNHQQEVESIKQHMNKQQDSLLEAVDKILRLDAKLSLLDNAYSPAKEKSTLVEHLHKTVNTLGAKLEDFEQRLKTGQLMNKDQASTHAQSLEDNITEADTTDLDHDRRQPTSAFEPSRRERNPTETSTLTSIQDSLPMLDEPDSTSNNLLETSLESFHQGDLTVSQFIRHGEEILRQYTPRDGTIDSQADYMIAQAFLNGLRHGVVRELFESFLFEHGFSWRNVLASHEQNLKKVREHLAQENENTAQAESRDGEAKESSLDIRTIKKRPMRKGQPFPPSRRSQRLIDRAKKLET